MKRSKTYEAEAEAEAETPKMKKSRTSEEDRISSLPEPIVHQIMSYLPAKDATRTSVLSRTWNSTWRTFPVMDFNHYSFLKSACGRSGEKLNLKKVADEFCCYVDEFITSRSGLITTVFKFQVVVNFTSPTRRERLDRWLNYAVENNVKDLGVAYHTRGRRSARDGWRYVLPEALFGAESLESLDLFGCRFAERSRLSTGIRFSLKSLKLSQVYVDQETLQDVVSNSCHLEELSIGFCEGFHSVGVSGPKLRTVDLYLARYEVQIFAIQAPNLQSLSYGGGLANVQASLTISSKFENVKEFRLHDVDARDDFFRVTEEFPGLEKLELNNCGLLESVRISGCRLLELCISECMKLREIEFDTSRLSSFRYDGCHMHFPV